MEDEVMAGWFRLAAAVVKGADEGEKAAWRQWAAERSRQPGRRTLRTVGTSDLWVGATPEQRAKRRTNPHGIGQDDRYHGVV